MGGRAEVALRAETARGESYDDPREDTLAGLVDGLGPGNQFVVVDRLGADVRFMQVYWEPDDTYAVEYRDGDGHFAAVTDDITTVRRVLAAWAGEVGGWRDALAWRPWQA